MQIVETSRMAEQSPPHDIWWFVTMLSWFGLVLLSTWFVANFIILSLVLLGLLPARYVPALAASQNELEVRRRRSPPAKRAIETNPAYYLWPRRDYDDQIYE